MLHIDLNEVENLDLTLNNFSSNSPKLLGLCKRFDIKPGTAPRAVFGRSGRVRVIHRKQTHVCEIALLPYDPDLSQQIMIWAYYGKVVTGSASGGFQRLFKYSTEREERRAVRKKNAAAKRRKERRQKK